MVHILTEIHQNQHIRPSTEDKTKVKWYSCETIQRQKSNKIVFDKNTQRKKKWQLVIVLCSHCGKSGQQRQGRINSQLSIQTFSGDDFCAMFGKTGCTAMVFCSGSDNQGNKSLLICLVSGLLGARPVGAWTGVCNTLTVCCQSSSLAPPPCCGC